MNILMVLDSKFPPDIRVEKEGLALIEAGFNVFVLSQYEASKPKIEKVNGITVLRFVNNRGNILGFLNRSIFLLTLFDNLFFLNIIKCVREFNIDVIHIHDLPLGKTGHFAAKKTRKKLILDLHENMPEALVAWRHQEKTSIKNAVMNIFHRFSRWKKYEKKCLKNADLIITVIEEMKQNLLASHDKLNEEKIAIVSNTEPLSFSKKEKDKDIMAKYSNAFYALYIGGLGHHRGIDTLIKSAQYLDDGVKILIVGGGAKEFETHLKSLLENSGCQNQIEWIGPQPFAKVDSFIAASSVGIIPHHSNPHCDNTIPHKLFHFMLEKKPLIVSSSKALKRVVEETAAGGVFQASDERDLANKINELYKNQNMQDVYGENGYKAATEGKYSWSNDKEKLIAAYQKLFNK